jgi:integrase
LANLRPGEPVFRGVTKGGEIGRDRLTDRSVALIIKKEVGPVPLRLAAARRTRTPWRSGHSLRAGYCTASAMAGIPEWKARRRSRHRSLATFDGYVRAAEDWTDSGLKGVGF